MRPMQPPERENARALERSPGVKFVSHAAAGRGYSGTVGSDADVTTLVCDIIGTRRTKVNGKNSKACV
jgi:hypothetical protein